MNITVTLGTWVFPLLITIACIVIAWYKDSNNKTGYDPTGYGRIGSAAVSAVYWVPAIVLSLVAWLLWALFFK